MGKLVRLVLLAAALAGAGFAGYNALVYDRVQPFPLAWTLRPEELELLWGSGDPEAFERAFGWQRANGWYGLPVAVPEDAPLQDHVLGVLGRDPNWTAP